MSESAIAWDKIRFKLLIFTGLSAVAITLKSILLPQTASQEAALKYQFPDLIPLESWQYIASQPLNVPKPVPSDFISGRSYRYTKSNVSLTVTMHYTAEKGGNLREFFNRYAPENIPLPKQERYQESTGFYTLLAGKDKAYLVSCINPRGSSTVSPQQFNGNRYKYDLQLPRLGNWLMGKGTIRDLRCLWTQLSIPLNRTSPQEAYSLLESAWTQWYKWWYPRFPQEY